MGRAASEEEAGMSAAEERAWLDALRRGEAEALDEMVRRYRDGLLALARARLGTGLRGRFDASDVVQTALLEAVRALPGFRGDSETELAGWLRGVLARVLAHEVRRHAGTQQRDARREVALEALAEALAGEQTSPSQAADRNEQQRRLSEALGRLPDDYRAVIVLRNLEGLSHEEVAARLGRGVGAARMLWVRALARLKEELETPS
jgi:RNA polymerase sigma-70 factor (ECF subfamily)